MKRLLILLILSLAISATSEIVVVNPGDTIQSRIQQAQPGDTVLVKPGVYPQSVALSKAIILKGEPGAILTDPNPGRSTGVEIQSNDCTVEGLRFENFAMAISAFNRPYARVKILRNHTYKNEYSCWISGDNWVIEGNEFERAYWWSGRGDCDYTRMFGRGHVFRGNYIHGTIFPDDLKPASGSDYAHCDGIQWYGDNGDVLEDVLIEYNYFTEYMDGLFFSAPGGQGRRNVVIRYNVFWGHNFPTGASSNFLGVPSWGIAVGLFDNKGTGIEIYNNLIRNTANALGLVGVGSGMVGHNLIVGPGTGYYYEGGTLPVPFTHNPDMIFNLSYIGHYDPPNEVVQNPQFRDVNNPVGADGWPFTGDDGWVSAATAMNFGPPAPGDVVVPPTPDPDPIPEPTPDPDNFQVQIDGLLMDVADINQILVEIRARLDVVQGAPTPLLKKDFPATYTVRGHTMPSNK